MSSSAAPAVLSVTFEVERFRLGLGDRHEVVGCLFGLRGRRFLRPTLDVGVAQAGTRLEELCKELDDDAASAQRRSRRRGGRSPRGARAALKKLAELDRSPTHSSKRAIRARDERNALMSRARAAAAALRGRRADRVRRGRNVAPARPPSRPPAR